MFICPICKTRLVRTENEHGVFWVCAACGGRAVNVPVLRKTVLRDYVNELWLSARKSTAISERACPACSHQMTQVSVSQGHDPLTLDVCKTCEFVWFDPKEFEATPHVPAQEGAEAALPLEARKSFAIGQVETFGRIPDHAPAEWWKLVPAIFGMPVEEDVNGALRATPWLTWALAGVILLVNSLVYSNLPKVIAEYGLIPAQAWRHGGLTFITSFFLHAGVIHLASNFYFLLVFGDNVEDYLGKRRYILLIALAALAGDLLHIALDPHSNIPCVGASGGIFAVITYYCLQFPHAQLGFFTRFTYNWVRMPAYVALMFWILTQIIGAWQQVKGFTGVSALAHLGGAAVGVGFWLKWRKG